MSTTLTNGRQRKSLAEQIDRLDSVLDGLADGLNEAVASAVKEAVRAVLSEMLTNPEVLTRLHAAQQVAVPAPCRRNRWSARAGTAFGQHCAGRPRGAARAAAFLPACR